MSVEARSHLPTMARCSPISASPRSRVIRAERILRSLRSRRTRLLQLAAAMLWPLALLAVIILLAGCTLGPTTEVRYVIVHPGQPIRILDRVSATGERLDGGGTATIDLSGWVAMPPDHWEVIAHHLNPSAATGTTGAISQPPAPALAPTPR